MASYNPKPLPKLSAEAILHFNAHIKHGSPDECWDWIKGTEAGYGRVKIAGRPLLSHRVAYYLGHDKDPGSLDVCHSCDRPICCNPAHLFLGTQGDNIRDAARKGRVKHKLTASEVSDIRTLHDRFGYAQAELCGMYKVTSSMMSCIMSRKRRASVP